MTSPYYGTVVYVHVNTNQQLQAVQNRDKVFSVAQGRLFSVASYRDACCWEVQAGTGLEPDIQQETSSATVNKHDC